jgi:hypothetical protein
MVQNLIVALIVGGSAWYAGMKYLPAKWIGRKKAAGCGSGCDSCNSCETPVPVPAETKYRVIKLHSK